MAGVGRRRRGRSSRVSLLQARPSDPGGGSDRVGLTGRLHIDSGHGVRTVGTSLLLDVLHTLRSSRTDVGAGRHAAGPPVQEPAWPLGSVGRTRDAVRGHRGELPGLTPLPHPHRARPLGPEQAAVGGEGERRRVGGADRLLRHGLAVGDGARLGGRRRHDPVERLRESHPVVGSPPGLLVAQQCDPSGARLGEEHIAIGRDSHPARIREPACEDRDGKALRYGRQHALRV